MKEKALIVIFALGVIISVSGYPSIGLSIDETDIMEFYESCIDSEIAKCTSKAVFLNSQSPNLRRYGKIETQKAKFLSNAKDMLIDEMIDKRIDPKYYKVEHFLNSRFIDAVHQ